MIINVRGTSGSGKSTLIRAVMKNCQEVTPIKTEGRKQPIGYVMHYATKDGRRSLFIPGHYETACGGCDTLGKYLPNVVTPRIIAGEEPNSYHFTFGLIRKFAAQGYNVLYEGLLLSGDVRHTKALKDDGQQIVVVCINIPIEQCLASVRDRRKAVGNEKPFNEDNTRDKHRLMQKCILKLKEAGVPVHDVPERLLARSIVGDLLGVVDLGQLVNNE